MSKNYYTSLINGSHGSIDKKHFDLRAIMMKKGIKNFDTVSAYIRQFPKYDNWTLRDIDKVCAILNA